MQTGSAIIRKGGVNGRKPLRERDRGKMLKMLEGANSNKGGAK